MSTYNKAVTDILGRLDTLLTRAGAAYREYLNAGKTYEHARILWKYNAALHDIIINESHQLPANLHQNALALLPHIDIWMEKWLAHEKQLQPAAEDLFVFENTVTFNKSAALILQDAFQKMLNG